MKTNFSLLLSFTFFIFYIFYILKIMKKLYHFFLIGKNNELSFFFAAI